MKMKIIDRLVMRLAGVLAVLSGALLFLVPLGVLGKTEFRFDWLKWVFYGAGALTVLIGLYVLFVPRRYRYSRKDFILHHSEQGDMRISIKAMETQVSKCADRHKEIRVHAMRIVNARDGVRVDMKVSLASNVSIPLSVESLQKQVKQYLLASTGVEIKEVRIIVVGTEGEMSGGPYSFENREEAAEQKTAEEKKPVHCRIFEHRSEEENAAGRKEEAGAPAAAESPAAVKAAESPAEETAAEGPKNEKAEAEEGAEPVPGEDALAEGPGEDCGDTEPKSVQE